MDEGQLYHHFLWVSAAIIAVTTFVHSVFIASAAVALRMFIRPAMGVFRFMRDSAVLAVLALWLMAAHLFQIIMWAWVFVHNELLPSWEAAIYFAAACYTTLGFGDLLLPEQWRLLSGVTAANGFLLFGLSTAFLFEVLRQLNLAGRAPRSETADA